MVPQWHSPLKAVYIAHSPPSPSRRLILWSFSPIQSMDRSSEGAKVDWLSVPAFGDWDNQKGIPDYSLDFSKVRQMRKQNKSDYARVSVGNEEGLLHQSKKGDELFNRSMAAVSLPGTAVAPAINRRHSPSGKKRVMSYFVCCIGA